MVVNDSPVGCQSRERSCLGSTHLMKDDGKYDRVVLCYIDGDEAARKLYEKLGFKHTGEADGDEIIMELKLR